MLKTSDISHWNRLLYSKTKNWNLLHLTEMVFGMCFVVDDIGIGVQHDPVLNSLSFSPHSYIFYNLTSRIQKKVNIICHGRVTQNVLLIHSFYVGNSKMIYIPNPIQDIPFTIFGMCVLYCCRLLCASCYERAVRFSSYGKPPHVPLLQYTSFKIRYIGVYWKFTL